MLFELFGVSALAGALVWLVLLVGQLAKVGDLLGAEAPGPLWARVLGLGGLILAEPALPLLGLIGAGLTYGRLRAEGGLIAAAALGWHPLRLLAPAAALGLVCAALALPLSTTIGPRAVGALGSALSEAINARFTRPGAAVTLSGGGVVRTIVGADGAATWAAWPVGSGAPALLRARGLRLSPGRDALELHDVQLWLADSRLRAGTLRLQLDDAGVSRRFAMFGPPNSLPSADLATDDVHHRFTWHRRWALPLMAPLWALLGALLGARRGGVAAVVLSAGVVGLAYWLLRVGELAARAGFGSPAVAAWAPAALLALGVFWLLRRA
ncbi:MAG: LptF/LptG family permease [Myxococcales bacterium]|nr:LptF/LptG family permease [Myxococcales bacterium]